jgi:hypothetical protein
MFAKDADEITGQPRDVFQFSQHMRSAILGRNVLLMSLGVASGMLLIWILPIYAGACPQCGKVICQVRAFGAIRPYQRLLLTQILFLLFFIIVIGLGCIPLKWKFNWRPRPAVRYWCALRSALCASIIDACVRRAIFQATAHALYGVVYSLLYAEPSADATQCMYIVSQTFYYTLCETGSCVFV